MMTGIYQIVCRTTGKRYIGSAASKRGFEGRWATHRKFLCEGKHSSPHFQAAWNKYGADDFYFGIIEIVDPAECLRYEQIYLNAVDKERLLNCKPTASGGGMHGKRHSEETRAKMSAAAKGKTMSDESKAKLSASKMGVKTQEYTEERAMKISQKLKEAWARRKNGQN